MPWTPIRSGADIVASFNTFLFISSSNKETKARNEKSKEKNDEDDEW